MTFSNMHNNDILSRNHKTVWVCCTASSGGCPEFSWDNLTSIETTSALYQVTSNVPAPPLAEQNLEKSWRLQHQKEG
jgi:hypothetical protein